MQTDKTAESVVEFVKELKGLAGERPIARRTSSRARACAACAAPRRSTRPTPTSAARSRTLWLQKRPLAELQAEPDRIAKVPLAATNAAAAKWARPEKAVVHRRRRPRQDRGEVEGPERGEIVVLDVEGKPVAK